MELGGTRLGRFSDEVDHDHPCVCLKARTSTAESDGESYRVVSCRIVSYRVVSCRIVSYRVVSIVFVHLRRCRQLSLQE